MVRLVRSLPRSPAEDAAPSWSGWLPSDRAGVFRQGRDELGLDVPEARAGKGVVPRRKCPVDRRAWPAAMVHWEMGPLSPAARRFTGPRVLFRGETRGDGGREGFLFVDVDGYIEGLVAMPAGIARRQDVLPREEDESASVLLSQRMLSKGFLSVGELGHDPPLLPLSPWRYRSGVPGVGLDNECPVQAPRSP